MVPLGGAVADMHLYTEDSTGTYIHIYIYMCVWIYIELKRVLRTRQKNLGLM